MMEKLPTKLTSSQTTPFRPSWLKVRPPLSSPYFEIKDMLQQLKLSTVCQEAHCPNMEECWGGGTATFMLMGDTCTRGCKFCAIKTGNPKGILDAQEPQKVGLAISKMGLKYVVLTSVDRDDLDDLGASHFAKTVCVIKEASPELIVECLTPDFQGKQELVFQVLDSKMDVFAHNLETVERLSPIVRDRRATYKTSLNVLEMAKKYRPDVYTKTSLMLGLGETLDEVFECLKQLREVDCDVVTFGQYLSPGAQPRYVPVIEYIRPRVFEDLEGLALEMGFKYCASGPLVRSSYKAAEYFLMSQVQNDRTQKIAHLS